MEADAEDSPAVQVVVCTGEAQELQSAIDRGRDSMGDVPFGLMLLGCGTFGMVLNFSQFMCTIYTSALTTTIVGVLKVMACCF